MAEEFRVTMTADLNESKTVAQVNKSLANIGKNLKLPVGDLKDVKTTFTQLDGEVKKVNKSILTFRDANGKVSKITTDANGNIKNMSTSVKELKTNTDNASKSTVSLGDSLLDSAKKMTYWLVVGNIIMTAKHAIDDAIKYVIEMDSALLELSKVTDLSESELREFGEEAQEVGKKLNATGAEITQLTADFARMGFAVSESVQLAEQAFLLSKVGDGIKSVDEASSSLISILKGFNLEASETEHVIDGINNVANNFATSAGDITEGMSRISAIMHQTNTTFDEAVGLFTSAFEVLQDSAKSASGIQTISSRLNRVKEDVEDLNGLTTNLGDAFQEYAGISLTDQNGQIKSTYDILVELASVWETMDEESQKYIAFLASGTRQANVFYSILGNISTATEATASSMNSAGSATEEFNKYLDSMQGKIDEFLATWNRIGLDLVKSGLVEFFLDLANGLSSTVEQIGFLNSALPIMFAILSATKLKAQFTALYTSLGLIAGSANGVSVAFNGVAASATVMNAALTAGLSVAIVALVAGISSIIKKHEEWEARLDASLEKLEELTSEIDALNSKRVRLEVEGVDQQQITLLEKELEIKRELLDIENKRAAKLINETIPAVKDYNEYTTSDATGIFALSSPEDETNLIAAYNAVANEIRRVRDEQEKLDISTESGKNQFETFSEVLDSLSEKQSEYNLLLLDQYRNMRAVPINELSLESRNYLLVLEDLLDVGQSQSEIIEQDRLQKVKNKDATEELADETKELVFTMDELSSQYNDIIESEELSAKNLTDMLEKYPQFIDYLAQEGDAKTAAIKLTEALFEVEKQKSAEIIRMKIKELEAEKQLTAAEEIRLEMLAQRGIISSEAFNSAIGYTSQLNNLYTSLNSILNTSIGDFSPTKSAKESVKETTKELKEYDSTMDDLNRKIHSYNLLVEQQATYDLDNYVEQIESAKDVIEEIEKLLELGYQDWSKMVLGTQEYADQEEYLRELGMDRYEWMQKINTIQMTITDELKEQSKIQREMHMKNHEAMNELLEATVKLIRQENEDYISQLETRKKSLAVAREEFNLQKTLANMAKDKSDLEEELMMLRLDGSENNNRRILEIEEELAKKQDEIDETLEEDAYKRKVDILDDEIDATQEFLNKDGLIRQEALDRLNEAFKDGTDELMNELIQWNDIYGSSIESDIVNMWEEAQDALADYIDMLGDISFSEALEFSGTAGSGNDRDILSKMDANAEAWRNAEKDTGLTGEALKEYKDNLHRKNRVLSSSLSEPVEYDSHSGNWSYVSSGKKAFANGGRVYGATDAIVGEGGMPETIINDSQMPSFLTEALRVAVPRIDFGSLSSTGNSSSFGDINVMIKGNIDSDSRVKQLGNEISKVLKNAANNRGLTYVGTIG